jgi:MYXO-CTERM domain-containing protein
MRISKTLMTGFVTAVAAAGSANAAVTWLTMTQVSGYPSSGTGFLTGTESAFTSEFNYQSNNNKLRLWNRSGGSSAPQAVVNPSNTYWGPNSGTNTGGPVRSWEISWDNTTKMFSTMIYDTADWTGSASASLSLATVNTTFGGAVDAGGDFTLRGVAQFASGTAFSGSNFYFRVNARVTTGSNLLSGININTRPDGATAGVGSIVLSNMQFDGGNGFVGVVGADGTYSGSQQNNYFALATVPAPGAMALLGVAGLAGSRRRRA